MVTMAVSLIHNELHASVVRVVTAIFASIASAVHFIFLNSQPGERNIRTIDHPSHTSTEILLPVRREQLQSTVGTIGTWIYMVGNLERPTVDVSSREKKKEKQRELHNSEKKNK